MVPNFLLEKMVPKCRPISPRLLMTIPYDCCSPGSMIIRKKRSSRIPFTRRSCVTELLMPVTSITDTNISQSRSGFPFQNSASVSFMQNRGAEKAKARFYTTDFFIRIFFEKYWFYRRFLKKDADKNVLLPDNRGINHKEVPLWILIKLWLSLC